MGRSLTEATKGSQTLSYTYNSDGIRTSKTVNGVKTEYLLNGTQILAQKTGNDVMWFFYDQQGNRVGMADSSNHIYYYLYNLQGDVIALADAETGKLAATYTYDAWGKIVSVKNASGYTIGTDNPFRYRGYYCDNETGFYYLNSRYYNPEVGRFINADAFVTTDITGALSANMFAYCENNPVNMVDPTGHGGIGLMSDWNPQEFHKKSPSGKSQTGTGVSRFLSALFKSLEIDIGFGMGLGGNVNADIASTQIEYSHNFLEFYLDDGEFGIRQAQRKKANVSVFHAGYGYNYTEFYDYSHGWIPYSTNGNDYFGPFYNGVSGLELSAYFYIGGSIRIGINRLEFEEKYLKWDVSDVK